MTKAELKRRMIGTATVAKQWVAVGRPSQAKLSAALAATMAQELLGR